MKLLNTHLRSSNEVIKPPSTPDNSLDPILKYSGKRMYLKFNESCFKQEKKHIQSWKKVNRYIVYDLK